MRIDHHPNDALLAAFAAGRLDLGQHVAVATHLVSCPACRKLIRAFERVGGTIMDDLPPVAMAADALAKIEARLGAPAAVVEAAAAILAEDEISGLPKFVRGYRFGAWKWIAPSTYMRPVDLPHASETRVFLLKAGPGVRLLEHRHTGVEMTCVLTGGFSQDGEHYGAGDFDFGDEATSHRPVVDADGECICLIAMQGRLKFGSLIGRIVQPFLSL